MTAPTSLSEVCHIAVAAYMELKQENEGSALDASVLTHVDTLSSPVGSAAR
eukprot:CAMPEP_0202923972 /NCGR_PEP_ID=MMETSP1392-20130828/78728_1 /ASSEMBLY_ACC=CAM_ASM_000868 /TAXON_ID=225041 /ORGANISM="Chlamydomonas chlamydogama, Strain SAG 11-48b" /LENGTH=50 /DNA_ID=CAMNT_0049617675 /DNA_START=657 /DNA_END=809 /DNA_ORIENTATION=-